MLKLISLSSSKYPFTIASDEEVIHQYFSIKKWDSNHSAFIKKILQSNQLKSFYSRGGASKYINLKILSSSKRKRRIKESNLSKNLISQENGLKNERKKVEFSQNSQNSIGFISRRNLRRPSSAPNRTSNSLNLVSNKFLFSKNSKVESSNTILSPRPPTCPIPSSQAKNKLKFSRSSTIERKGVETNVEYQVSDLTAFGEFMKMKARKQN
jgi:hypothetical protein